MPMPPLSIAQQVALGRKHGFTDDELPDLCAVIMTESGGWTDRVQGRSGGDLRPVPGLLGRGLVQIDLGQHPSVTEAQAFDPDFAMGFARQLSRNSSGLGPTNWYGPRDSPAAADAARAAARQVLGQEEPKEEEPMETWLPGARRVVPASTTSSPFIGCAWKVCLHTTEGGGNWDGSNTYHGSQSYPHFEVQDGVAITQFFPIDVAARALYNAPGGYETNRANVVQIEIAGSAAKIASVTDDVLDKLATIIRFVHDQTGMAMQFPLAFRLPFTAGYRLEGQDLYDCEGVIGHQHFGEGNDHTDPGLFPVPRLQSRLGTTTQPEGEPTNMLFRYVFDGVDWVFDGPSRLYFHTDHVDQIEQVLDEIKVPALGKVSANTHRRYKALAEKAGFTG